MISYQEAFNYVTQSKQAAPSAQLKPVVKQPVQPKPNIAQTVLSTARNFVSGVTKNPLTAAKTLTQPIPALVDQVSKSRPVKDIYSKTVKPGSTLDTIIKGKFNEVPKALVSDFKYAADNANKDLKLTTKVGQQGASSLNPEEKQFLKERNFGVLGSVDAGGMFPSVGGAQKVEQKVAQTVPKPVNPVKPPANVPPNDDLVGRIIKDVKSAVPVRNKQQELYSAELRERAAKVAQAGETLTGEEAHRAQKAALKGELAPDPDFAPVRGNYAPEDVGKLKDTIEANTVLRPLEKVDAKDALDKLLDGKVPQKAEIEKLKVVFGSGFAEVVSTKSMTGLQKVVNKVAEVANIPRALNSSVDLSASGRQAIFAIPSHPIAAAKSFVKQFQAALSEGGNQKVIQSYQSKPSFKVGRDVGVAFTDTKGVLSGKEEAYMSNLAEKIPFLGPLVRASDRGYAGLLNNFRAELFDGFYKNAVKLGRGNDMKLLKQYAGLVNNMTGRGNLGAANRYAPLLNGAFFSPRLMASRIQLMNPAYYARLEAPVRKEAMKSLVAFVGTGLSILGMAKAAGLEVGVDPRSSDFGKIKVGNTRYDVWGGFSQYAVLLSRLILNQSVSSTSGKVTEFGEGYKPTTRKEIVGRFLESKLAPVASITNDLLKGTDQLGQPLKVLPEDISMDEVQDSQVFKRLSPFFVQDFMKLVGEYGLPVGALMSVPGFFGIGGNTYGGESTTKTKKPKIGPTVLR